MPVEIQTTRWKTFDGLDFATEAEAVKHEAEHYQQALVGLTAEQVAAAVARQPDAIGIANALEKAGTTIAKVRLAQGERRRARNGGGGETDPTPAHAPPHDPETGEIHGGTIAVDPDEI